MDSWLDLRVRRKEQLTSDVVKLELVETSECPLPPFEPGAYIDVQIPGGILRPYSLCNSGRITDRYEIAVRREANSRGGSIYLHDEVKVGEALRVRHPLNDFPLNPSATYSALFAGGIGIAPLLSMAEALWQRGSAFEIHLCAKNEQQAPFASYLKKAPYGNRVNFHFSERGGGRIDFDRALQRLSPLSHIYVCGPAAYMNAAIGSAANAGIGSDRIHFECFS